MHPVNKLLSYFGFALSGLPKPLEVPIDFLRLYQKHLNEIKKNNSGFKVVEQFQYDAGTHPESYITKECEFATQNLSKRKPASVLDIGSYRLFVVGLLAGYNVTTLDIRKRCSIVDHENILTSDAKSLDLPSESFDSIVSLCSLEHFGLGRYGEEFDLDADKKAFAEMVRVLRPGGILIFSTTITRGDPTIAFNAHRIYNYEMIRTFCNGLKLIEERYYSHAKECFCSHEEIINEIGKWDVYCGCWEKQK